MRSKTEFALVNRTAIVIVLSLLVCAAFVGCQSYTTGLQKSQTRVDETAVIGAMRTIASAQRTYALSNGGDYGTFEQLSESGYLDSRFASEKPHVKGYVLTMKTGEKEFSCNADPSAGEQNGRHFFIDSRSAVIRVNPSQPASATDAALGP